MRLMKEQVSIIGLGAMGSALAHVLIRGGYPVTVWNRTTTKAAPLVQQGALLAGSVASAVKASPVVLVCVDGYDVSRHLLGSVDGTLAGHVLLELSTGTPQDARNAEAWVRERGADYLDGAIMATPSQMGRPDTTIFVSGAGSALQRSRHVLETLAGNVIYLGEPVGAASAWDLAVLSCLFGAEFGFLHGARIFESERLDVRELGSVIARISPALGEMIKHTGDVIASGEFGNPQSSVKTCHAGFELFAKQAREAQITSDFPAFVLRLSKRAMTAGYDNEEFAALIKVLRAPPSSAPVAPSSSEITV
jgi:3-hydroxyisobutyrate dehydrogenase-like beta-hydroxyacid dehydrogenase